MVRPQEIVDAVVYTLQQSDDLPDETNFLGFEPDIENQPINLPLIEVSTGVQTDLSEMNTDFVSFIEDGDGNQVGRVYETLYTIEITVAAWTAAGSRYDPREIGNYVRDALYQHDTAGPDKPLTKSDGSTVDEVWRFIVESGEQTDDFSTSPTLRRWEQRLVVSASEQYTTDDPFIEDVNVQTEQ